LRRLAPLIVLLLLPLALSGCVPRATFRSITSSRDPVAGGTAVTFTANAGDDNQCAPDGLRSAWNTEDNPDVWVSAPFANGHWILTHAFPALPAGVERTYLVKAQPDPIDPIGSNCPEASGTQYRETVTGGPVTGPGPGPGPGSGPAPGPSAAFTYNPADPYQDETVTFDATTSTDNGGQINACAWHFDADTTPIDPTTGCVVRASFQTATTHTVSLTVSDDQGRSSTISRDVTAQTGVRGKRAARSVFVAAAAPAVTVSTSPNPAAQAVTHLFATLGPGAGKVSSYQWDFNGGKYDATTRAPTVAHVFGRAGSPLMRVRAKLAGGGALTGSTQFAVAKPSTPAHGSVTQPFRAQITSRSATRSGVKGLLRSLSAGASHKGGRRRRSIADTGSFRLRVLGSFRPGAAQLLAPLLSATTRGATHLDLKKRVFRATYLLNSGDTGSRTCLGVVVHYTAAGARGTLKTLGGTGLAHRLHLAGSFGVLADPGLTQATLAGTLTASRGKARGLPAACRALKP
jgi:PKD repeat protein